MTNIIGIELNEDSMLLCPVCGFSCLHQEKTETFERSEDELKGMHTIVEGSKTMVVCDKLPGNPSSRRDGMIIHFSCEGCGEISKLAISQHKGHTIVEWYNSHA